MLRQLVLGGPRQGPRQTLMPSQVSFQDMGGRITRYPLRSSEKTDNGKLRDVQLGHRWMDAHERRLFLPVPDHAARRRPASLDPEMEIELCWAYNRWLTEKALPESDGRFYSMLALPFSDPDEAMRAIETFGDRKHVTGFMITSVRTMPVHHNSYMKVYRAIEERGLSLAFHSAVNIGRAGVQEPQPLRLGARARLPVLQHPAHDQLGHQRARRALPEAAGDLDRGRARLGAVPDAAARS